MLIQTVSTGLPRTLGRTHVASPDGGRAVPIALAAPEAAAPQASKEGATPGQIVPLLTKGTALGTVYKGGSFLLTQVNETSSSQVAGVLQQYNLVKDPGMAQSQADRIIELLQSKGTNSLLIGAVAGTWMAVAVDVVRPGWPLWSKALIGFITAALVASLLYFGLEDKPVSSPAGVGQTDVQQGSIPPKEPATS